jgi:hypothetical protein
MKFALVDVASMFSVFVAIMLIIRVIAVLHHLMTTVLAMMVRMILVPSIRLFSIVVGTVTIIHMLVMSPVMMPLVLVIHVIPMFFHLMTTLFTMLVNMLHMRRIGGFCRLVMIC